MPSPPARDRQAHADTIEQALNAALAAAQERDGANVLGDEQAARFYLQFQMPAGQEQFVQNLEDRRRRIELVSVRQDPGEDAPLC